MECLPRTIKERRKISYYEKYFGHGFFVQRTGTSTRAFKQKNVRCTGTSNGRERVKVATPVRSVRPPWDLDAVLRYRIASTFESLSTTPLRSLSKKVLFLVALATAKRVGKLQAISRYVSFASSGACLAYVPEFLAKTESALHPLPRSFLVKSPADFAAGVDQDLLLCPVRVCANISGGCLRRLIVLVVFLFLLILPLVRCRRMVSRISFERSFMRLVLAER